MLNGGAPPPTYPKTKAVPSPAAVRSAATTWLSAWKAFPTQSTRRSTAAMMNWSAIPLATSRHGTAARFSLKAQAKPRSKTMPRVACQAMGAAPLPTPASRRRSTRGPSGRRATITGLRGCRHGRFAAFRRPSTHFHGSAPHVIAFPGASAGNGAPAMREHRQARATPPRPRERRPIRAAFRGSRRRRAPLVMHQHHGAPRS